MCRERQSGNQEGRRVKGNFSSETMAPSHSLEPVWTVGLYMDRDLARLWEQAES